VLLATSLVDDLLGRFGYAAVFGFVGIESLGIPLPGETMLISASLYAGATHRLSIAVIIVVAAAGAIVGDNIGYGLGHWGGYRLLLRYGRYIRLHEGRVKLARHLFRRHGGKVVFFGRFVSVLRTYAAFLAGTARMPWPRFLVFNAGGGVVWATLYGVGAYLAGDRITKLSTPVDLALGGLAVVVIVSLVLVLRRQEERLTAEAERALPGPLERP
jgi:membrane protein DedA with SNARE-associated domain